MRGEFAELLTIVRIRFEAFAMKTYEFTVIVPDLDDYTIDAIAGGCPDSGVGTRESKTFIDFDRQADSLGQAIDSAVADLEALGIKPIRVLIDMPQPVTT